MENIPTHPMDDFPVRPLKFDLSDMEQRELLWSRSSPRFSMFINAFGVHVPYFERYLIRAMGKAKAIIKDPVLLRDVGRIVGQEAHHAKNFIDFNKALIQRYPAVAKYDADANAYFSQRSQKDSLKRLIGFTAGYETFTFLAGAIILRNYERWLSDSDSVIKAMWVWHQVEEVEHGAVAFDVYQHLYGEFEWYRKRMVVEALWHMAKEAMKTYTQMAKTEGWLKNPFVGAYRLGFCVYMLGLFVINGLPALRKGYHPKNHPLVTREQNPIQIAWRRFEKTGGDVLEIDRHKMAEIMKLAPVAEAA